MRTTRHPLDFYPTPQSIIDALLSRWEPSEGVIWEPCCGDNRFALAIAKSYRQNVLGHDIVNGHDFFLWDRAKAKILITNPPYKYIRKFIDHAFDIGVEEMALVCPERLWACGKGREQFQRHRPSIFANMDWREDYLQKGGSPDRALAVSIWNSPHSETCEFQVWSRV